MCMANWPVIEGRYELGNLESPVAVCTLGTPVLDLSMDSIAIKGPCVIENIGVEKVVKNLVANPRIRFLVLCGKKSKGHFTDQAFISLKERGIDPNKRIVGAKGAMPILRNITQEEVEAFQKQIEIVDLSDEVNPDVILKTVGDCISRDPGVFCGQPASRHDVKTIIAEPSDNWQQDPNGFFIVFPDAIKGQIMVEHYTNDNVLREVISGKSAAAISKKIDELRLVGLTSHALYLGRELTKAEIALREEKEYKQD